MTDAVQFDQALIEKYDFNGPRYTSYPTANLFQSSFDEQDMREALSISNGQSHKSDLSVYIHLPFCESLCYYCACNKVVTRNRQKAADYLEALYSEIGMACELLDPGRRVTQIHLGGGTPTYYSDTQLSQLMDTLAKNLDMDDGQQREFSIELDPRTIDTERITNLADMGFNRFSFGIQDYHAPVQLAINRVQSADQVDQLVSTSREQGIGSLSVDLIYGLPNQTVKSFDKTLRRVIAQQPDRVAVYNYAHLPERFRAQRLLNRSELPQASDKLAMLNLTITLLQRTGYRYIGMDHFALPDDAMSQALDNGTLQRNFQGYSTHAGCDLIGFGASAISHIGQFYVQNIASVRDYMSTLDGGHLPIAKGLKLNRDDQIRSDIINQLMCYSKLEFHDFDDRWQLQFQDAFHQELFRLEPLRNDGLVDIDRYGIQVTPRGRLLLRQIAMCFDPQMSAVMDRSAVAHGHESTRTESGRFSRAI